MNNRLWLGLILAGYLLVTLAYGSVNPLFEAPDEHLHYFTVQYIKDNDVLPFVAEEYDEWLGQEAAQPPLYYWLGSLFIGTVDTRNSREKVWFNPFFYAGDASVLANRNLVIHTAAEAWPWQGVPLAAHLLRVFSTMLGLGTLLSIYGCGRLLWPDNGRNALLATALVAFLPQFNFIQATISNDSLITFLSAFALWQLLWLWFHEVRWTRLLLLGITGGLAALSKNAGLLLIAYSVGVLFLRSLKENGFRRWAWQTAVFVILPVVAVTGWLWLRNYQLYGDVTATQTFIRLADGDRGYTLLEVLGKTNSLVRSLVAVFGWFNLLAPTWVYAVWGLMVIVALIGVIKTAVQNLTTDHRLLITDYQSLLTAKGFPAILLLIWFLLVYAGLVAFMLRTPAAQGRLIFPALVPVAMGLVYGLTRWHRPAVYWLAPAAALLTTLYCCFFVIRPAYAQPAALAELPEGVKPVNIAMRDGLTLVGVDLETETAVSNDIVWLNLYWQANPVPAEPPDRVVELLGRDLALAGKAQSYHGGGLYPANLWPASQIILDRVGFRVHERVDAPVLAPAYLRLGGEEGVPVGEVKIEPTAWPDGSGEVLAQIGEDIEVTAVSFDRTPAKPGDTMTIDVIWRVTRPPLIDLTTLLHLAEAGQPPLATGDAQPLQGQYPTRVWEAGEVIKDQYILTIPPDLPHGRYPLWLGMYDSATITRWPLYVDGQRQPNDLLLAGWINVSE